jgi:hypothetical protein
MQVCNSLAVGCGSNRRGCIYVSLKEDISALGFGFHIMSSTMGRLHYTYLFLVNNGPCLVE